MKNIVFCFISCISVCLCACASDDTASQQKRITHLENKVAELERRLQVVEESASPEPNALAQKFEKLIGKLDESFSPASPTPDTAIPIREPDSDIQASLIPDTMLDTLQDTTSDPVTALPGPSAQPVKEAHARIAISKKELRVIMARSKSRLRRCGFKEGAAITFQVRIAATGMVSSVHPLPPHEETTQGRCATNVLYRVIFPATGQTTDFSHTYTF